MAEAQEATEEKPKKKSRLPLLVGLFLMIALGGGGFFAVYKGLILGHGAGAAEEEAPPDALPDIAFVPINPLVVSLGPSAGGRYLHFTSQLEVGKSAEEEVTLLLPRILDVLNGYLRAVEIKELEDPTALMRLRAQMLRRVQIVTGEGRVRDLLVTEFVIN
jgi:flagellar FliL protein